MTKIKNTNDRLGWFTSSEKPILEILLETESKLIEKSLLKLKKRKKIVMIIKK